MRRGGTVTLVHLLNLIVGALAHAGAHHASLGAVSDTLGWVTTKHWIVRVCEVGTKGCHL
jgi:hypothetical protein